MKFSFSLIVGVNFSRLTCIFQYLKRSRHLFLKLFRRKANFSEADYLSEYRRTGNLTKLGERHIDMVFALFFRYLRDEDDAKNAVM